MNNSPNVWLKYLFILSGIGVFRVHYSCRQEDSHKRLFVKLTPQETNITFENALEEEPLFNSINYLYFYDGGGVAVGDLNNDGLPDIYAGETLVMAARSDDTVVIFRERE